MELIKIKNLTVGYDSQPIVSNISMSVNSCDYIGVIGPNGGGKTTFIKTLVGAITPIDGEIIFSDKNLKIGYLPQNKSIDTSFPISVRDVVLSGLINSKKLLGRYNKSDKQNALRLLSQMGIALLEKRTIGDLSGGELQRVLLCRALISDPKILILDEPTTFVDSQFERELYDLLEELNQRMAIIMVSHDLGTISRRVKSIACINRCFHYHLSNIITNEQLAAYDCPLQIITHGTVPHTVLLNHKSDPCECGNQCCK